jgi:hypothetical protein
LFVRSTGPLPTTDGPSHHLVKPEKHGAAATAQSLGTIPTQLIGCPRLPSEHFGSEVRNRSGGEWRVWSPQNQIGFLGWGCSYLPLHTLHTFHTLHSYKERVINNKRRPKDSEGKGT